MPLPFGELKPPPFRVPALRAEQESRRSGKHLARMPTFTLGCELEPWIQQGGHVLASWPKRDSVALVAEMDGRRAFFRRARTAAAAAGLARVVDLYQAVRHPALPPLWGHWQATDGPTLVYEWVEGESLRDPQRFLRLSQAERRAALDTVFDLHLALANRGFVSCGFGPGSLLYDYEARRMWVTGLEDYRLGAFRNWRPRQGPFAAPEEGKRGARLDERTTVYHLGCAAQLLLEDHHPAIEQAVSSAPSQRQPRVGQLVRSWR